MGDHTAIAVAAIAIAATGVVNSGRSGYFLGVVADDPFGQALQDLDRVLDVNLERLGLIKRRIAEIQRQRSDGFSYTEIVEAAPPPLLVQLVTESKQTLD